MNLFRQMRDEVARLIEVLAEEGSIPAGLDTRRISVEPPRDPAHGDMATNAAMVLAKPAAMKPGDLAALLVDRLGESPGVRAAEIAGPGFINLRLDDTIWRDCLADILATGVTFGHSDIGGGEPVNVEYVSANPTGPLHIGHARGTVFGDVLASLLSAVGYDVCREYYINDAGAQVEVLARSAYLRYREALGEDIGEIPEGLYPGDYLKPVGKALADKDGDKWCTAAEEDWLPALRSFTVDAMMDLVRADLAALGVVHDVFTSEDRLVKDGKVDAALQALEDRGLIHVGVLEPPKGKQPDDWEPRPQTLFKATEFGVDVDAAVKKSDGSWTYFASDVAYHWDKFQRGFANQVDVWGADHAGHVKRMVAAIRAITGDEASLDVKTCQIVRLMDKGQPVKMSKRAGTFVTLRDLIDEVGPDVVRFIMLTRKNDAGLDFDLTAVTEKSRDNPVFYVQYAHARTHSVGRMAKAAMPGMDISEEALRGANLELLADDSEIALIRTMGNWPRTVESAALAHEPHRIAFYLYDLASAFHTLWTKGKEDAQLRFIIEEDPGLTLARLALVHGVRTVIASGLNIFGVEPVEEMR
ncbi:MAG: arginine--tRNA ligase [Alphaproteobacteria bacterium]|nr:arginine--tRNA ligase [Alphaproteobacteria bacterium]